MTGAMRQAGQAVVRAEAMARKTVAGSRIQAFAWCAEFCRIENDLLAFALDRPGAFEFAIALVEV